MKDYLLLSIDWSIFDREFMGEKVADYIWFAVIMLATFLLKKPMAALLTRISSRLAARFSYIRHKGTIRNMLFKPMERLLQTVLYFVAINQLGALLDRVAIHHTIGTGGKINIRFGDVVDHVFYFLFIIFLTQVITRFIDFLYYLRMGKAELEKNHARMQLLPLLREMTKLFSWTLSVFWILGSVFHVNIPALITGLGIGGVAIALAGKETVENFFAAFTILSDKPFQTGETIKLGDIEGVVERIGFRSTRLRNSDGSAYIIPNQNLVSQNLINLSARDNRGMKVAVNIKYGISHTDLEALITKVQEAVKAVPLVKDPVEAHIETFDKETFQLVVSYQLPHPLPEDTKLTWLKRDVNMKVYEIIARNAQMGAPVGTS
jgi:MscS family membrane protein